jgi:hypothetical protein
MPYKEFEVRIQASPKGGYQAEVLDSPFGRGKAVFKLPFSQSRMLKLPEEFERMRSGKANGKRPPSAETIGQALFRSLFAGDVGIRFHQSLASLEGQRDQGLRIRLTFDHSLKDPVLTALSALPWELLWNAERNDFLSRMRQTPIVRYLEVSRPPLQPLKGRLRVLPILSAPKNLAALKLDAEWAAIQTKLAADPRIEVSSTPCSRIMDLRKRLADEPWHVLHFMGHGGFNLESEEGYVYFEDDAGNARPVTGRMLAETIKSFPDLRLVFFNACQTGVLPRLHGRDPYTATAAALVEAGIPAVIAMQASVSDPAAIAFSSTFYGRIAAGDPVDAAAVEGRQAILQDQYFDWATPVVFTRVPDSDILGRSVKVDRGSELAAQPVEEEKGPLRLAIRTFADTGDSILRGQEKCDDTLELQKFFEGKDNRYPKDPAVWQTEVLPRLRNFLVHAASSRRPLHINFAAHASLVFTAGYFLEAKSGLDITIRQRTKAGTVEWHAVAGPSAEEKLFLDQEDLPGKARARDVAFALGVTHPVLEDTQIYLKKSRLAVRRILPATLAPTPAPLGVRDGLHALQLAEVIASKMRDRTIQERQGILHLFAAAPNALLFFLGQLSRGLGRIQLYEHDFGGEPGAYSPSILLPSAKENKS